ncbi:MAG: DNA-binding protein [Rhodanobacteraceae bacterium]
MSIKHKCLTRFIHIALGTPGSNLTRRARVAVAKEFVRTMFDVNLQIRGIESVATRHFQTFVDLKRKQGVSVRTLQNIASHLRKILEIGGRRQFAADPHISNHALGISGSSRRGTNRAVSAEEDQQILQAAKCQPPHVLAAVLLQRALGLRVLEAVQCGPSLDRWEAKLLSGEPIHVIVGTKGGRSRHTHPYDRDVALHAVRFALEVIRTGGRQNLFPHDTLRKAIHSYENIWHRHLTPASKQGCTSHSYRYAYAQNRIIRCLNAGMSKRDALAIVSLDLGHGDGRGRHVRTVYAQTIKMLTRSRPSRTKPGKPSTHRARWMHAAKPTCSYSRMKSQLAIRWKQKAATSICSTAAGAPR